jgi:transposase
MEISTIGLDLAKNVFQAHGADAAGAVVFRKRLRRAKVLAFFAKQPACLVAMEACAGAHYWAREIGKLGHTVRLIPPAYVKPFVKRQKNDAADAEAICEAAQRPTMRFVAVKSEEQQASAVVFSGARSAGAAAHPDDQRLAGPSGRIRAGRRPRPRSHHKAD